MRREGRRRVGAQCALRSDHSDPQEFLPFENRERWDIRDVRMRPLRLNFCTASFSHCCAATRAISSGRGVAAIL
jgi:hypothetical protein